VYDASKHSCEKFCNGGRKRIWTMVDVKEQQNERQFDALKAAHFLAYFLPRNFLRGSE
jgi:hypothetical protein